MVELSMKLPPLMVVGPFILMVVVVVVVPIIWLSLIKKSWALLKGGMAWTE